MAKKAAKKAPAKKATTAKAPAKKAATTKKVAAKKAPAKKATAAKGAANTGFMKAMGLSPELQKIIGKAQAARTEVTKGLWAYIKKHNLQDPKNRRSINADDALKAVFGKAKVDMFEMTKLIGKHLK